MFILFMFFFIIILNQYKIIMNNDDQIKMLNKQIADATKFREELTAQSEYKESDEYIEKIAREYGMVKPNEIIFIEQNKE